MDDIYRGLRSTEMQLWVWLGKEIHAALVTTLQEKNDVKFCLYLCLGGSKMDESADHQPIVEDWARSKGCTEMRVYGRRAWGRKFGFTEVYTKMTREL